MPRRRHDTKPELFPDHPVSRIFGEPRFCQFPVGSCVRLNMWMHEDGSRTELTCDTMEIALKFIAKIRERELETMEDYWARFPEK